jgi:hypothetical protein
MPPRGNKVAAAPHTPGASTSAKWQQVRGRGCLHAFSLPGGRGPTRSVRVRVPWVGALHSSAQHAETGERAQRHTHTRTVPQPHDDGNVCDDTTGHLAEALQHHHQLMDWGEAHKRAVSDASRGAMYDLLYTAVLRYTLLASKCSNRLSSGGQLDAQHGQAGSRDVHRARTPRT